MDRKKFIKKSIAGLGSIIALPSFNSCKSNQPQGFGPGMPPPPPGGMPPPMMDSEAWDASGACPTSPQETAGPFPIKTPAQLVRENIVVDRKGIPLLINLCIKNNSANCKPLANVFVDIWHCDADGNYSEYGDIPMQKKDYTKKHFLRGRQTTDSNGQVSFISIFPGWYQGRAPHIHVEVLDKNEKSLLVSQIAFEENQVNVIYTTKHYRGPADQKNETDMVFSNSLAGNMADSLIGNNTDGYVLEKTFIT
jgi:protocatechuate 3,4-dioxygenase beta subunit